MHQALVLLEGLEGRLEFDDVKGLAAVGGSPKSMAQNDRNNNNKYLNSAKKTLYRLFRKFELTKELLAGRFTENWQPAVKSVCVTGCAQISICWQRLYQLENDIRYFNAALKMNDNLKRLQLLSGSRMIRGGLPSSYPIWGDYSPYTINSWGIKYFIDSLFLEQKILTDLKVHKN